MIDAFARLCGTGQLITDITGNNCALSSAWFDFGSSRNRRQFGAGQPVIARFAVQVAAACTDPDGTVNFSIVHTPITVATPTTARTIPAPTFTNGTDVVNSTAHGLLNGTRVIITATGGIPTGLAVDTSYWVINATANTFQLAANPNSSTVVLFSTDGTPAHTIQWFPEILVSSGPIPWQRLVAGYSKELVLPPFASAMGQAIFPFLHAMFDGPTDVTNLSLTCDVLGGMGQDGHPYNNINYATA
jgi:hypothetical protein